MEWIKTTQIASTEFVLCYITAWSGHQIIEKTKREKCLVSSSTDDEKWGKT